MTGSRLTLYVSLLVLLRMMEQWSQKQDRLFTNSKIPELAERAKMKTHRGANSLLLARALYKI